MQSNIKFFNNRSNFEMNQSNESAQSLSIMVRLSPVERLVQKIECAYSVDSMRAIEAFNAGLIVKAKQFIVASHLCILIGDP